MDLRAGSSGSSLINRVVPRCEHLVKAAVGVDRGPGLTPRDGCGWKR